MYGGDLISALFYDGQAFFKSFGRNPSQSELDIIAPSYVGADHRIANLAGGAKALAEYRIAFGQTPPDLQERILKVNDLNAQVAVATAEAQLVAAQKSIQIATAFQPESTASVPPIFAVGGGPLGYTTPPAAGPPSKAPVIIGAIVAAVLFYIFRKKVFGWFR